MSPPTARPPIHVLAYGDFGAGKSTFAATFPQAMIVFCFDAYAKEMPYLRVGGKDAGVTDLLQSEFGVPMRQVVLGDDVLVQVEYYHDVDFIEPEIVNRKAGRSIKDMKPAAYQTFLRRMARFQDEYTWWRTAVVDSVTSMEMAARRWDQFTLNPNAEDARQWYGNSKDLLERMLINRMAQLPMNVVVLAHVDDEKFEHQGKQRRMPMAPGKLRGSLPSQFSEVYHVAAADNGEHVLQTRSDTLWAATTQIDAPNPCAPQYDALWRNWR